MIATPTKLNSLRHLFPLLICIWAMLSPVSSIGQNPTLNDANAQLRALFGNLNRPDPQKRFLYEMAVRSTDSMWYERNVRERNESEVFYAVYEEMYHSAYDTSTLLGAEELFASGNRFLDDTIALGIMNYDMYFLKPDALSSDAYFHFDTINDVLSDKVGRFAEPYLEGGIFMGAPLTPQCSFRNPTFRIAPEFLLQDAQNASLFTDGGYQLRIDFGDGAGWISFSTTQEHYHRVTYRDTGIQQIRFGIFRNTTSSTPIFTSVSQIIVQSGVERIEPDERLNFPGIRAGLFKTCNQNPANEKLVIYLEGFDMMDFYGPTNRDIFEIYNDVIRSRDIVQLRNQGYSFLVVDWKNSRTDMRYNALYLMNMLEALKCRFQSAGNDEQFVIIGESMGGVIARYALTYMESNFYLENNRSPFFQDQFDLQNLSYAQNNPGIYSVTNLRCDVAKRHNTRLLMTFDSPHQGANLPMGLQYAYKNVTNLLGVFSAVPLRMILRSLNAFLDCQAAQQLLIDHIDTERNWGVKEFSAHSDRTRFMNQLASLGNYPRNAKVMLLSSGAMNGTPQRNFYINQDKQPLFRIQHFDSELFARILWFKVPIFGVGLRINGNPDGVGTVFQANAGTWGLRIKLKWFGVRISFNYNSLIDKDERINTRPYCNNAGGYIGSETPLQDDQDRSHDVNFPGKAFFINLFSYNYIVDGAGCVRLRSHLGLNGLASANFNFNSCSDGYNFCFVPVRSALDNGNVRLDALNTNFTALGAVGTLAGCVREIDVLMGVVGSANNYHLSYRNEVISNISRNQSTFGRRRSTFFSCDVPNATDHPERSILAQEIGDEELFLENNNLNWTASFTSEYNIHINVRNPYYDYPSASRTMGQGGVYSREEPFLINQAGFARFKFHRAPGVPNSVGLQFQAPQTGNWIAMDQPLEVCCLNFRQRTRREKSPTSQVAAFKTLRLAPNPVQRNTVAFSYSFLRKTGGVVKATILNSIGQVVHEEQWTIPQTNQPIQKALKCSSLRTGAVYFLRLQKDGEVLSDRFFVQP